MGRILLQDKRVVNAVWLCSSCADLHIVGKASLQSLAFELVLGLMDQTYTHSCVQSSCNVIILFQTRAASKNLREPELVDGTLDVRDLPLWWWWGLNPLRRLTPNSTDHIGMREGLWCSLSHLAV